MSSPLEIQRAGLTWPQRLALPEPDVDTSAWQLAVDPDDAGLFRRRVAWQALMASPEPPQPWVDELLRLRSSMSLACDANPPDVPFSDLLWPRVNDVWARLGQDCDLTPWSPRAQHQLRTDLARCLAEISTDAFYAAFTHGRPAGAQIMATLGWTGGDTRYRHWCDQQRADGLTQILDQYPVLGRLLATTTLTWAASTTAMIRRLARHRDGVSSTFGIGAGEAVARVTTGLSDPHRGGHRVAVLEFTGGQRLVYKPKDLRVEQWFSEVVRDVNGLADVQMTEITVLPCESGYGFTSFVQWRAVTDLARFYRAAGRLCALLYLLGATDAHYENVIAAGSSLALIDSETLFHVDLEEAGDWADTVLRTGMLPSWSQHGDPSALGASMPRQVAYSGWAHLNSDDMSRARRTEATPQMLSSPVEQGQPNPLQWHVDDLVQGFREAYRDRDLRERLITRLSEVEGLPQRVVLRSTRVYALVQQQARTAEALSSGQARGLVLEQLSRAALVRGTPEPLWDVFQAEVQEMESLDVPYFTHVLGSPEVHGALGSIAGIITRDPLTEAAHRLRRTDDLEWQERLLRASVQARFAQTDQPPSRRAPTTRGTFPDPTPTAILSQIETAALRPGTWMAVYRTPDGKSVRLGMIGAGWYDGRAGLSAVQRWAGELSSDSSLLRQAAQTSAPLLRALSQPDHYSQFRFVRDLGLGFCGVGGLLRFPLPVATPPDLIARDRTLDFIAGVAGLIGALPVGPELEAAAGHLAAAQLPSGGWQSAMGSQPLTGLAHGAAGMGLALLQAGVAAGRNEWIDAGARAFAYENSLFEDGNWPDLRHPGGPPMVAWCHGAPGIGLARMAALALLPDHPDADRWHDDLAAAMLTTALAPLPATDHLCCGLTGRAAVLRICGRERAEPHWLAASDDLTDVVRAGYRQRGHFVLPLDEPQGLVSPGLMTGLAGIAAHLLSVERDTDLRAFLM